MTDQIVKLGNIRKGTQKMKDPSSGRVYSGGYLPNDFSKGLQRAKTNIGGNT